MKKRITLVCFFILCLIGIKAQTTYCYHHYKHIDQMGVPDSRNDYVYISFKGNLLWESEKDGSYKKSYDGTQDQSVYKYLGEKVDECLYYGMYEPQLMEGFDPLGFGQNLYHMFYYLVPNDKSIINKVTHIDGKFFTDCYKLCPNADCEPNIPVLKR